MDSSGKNKGQLAVLMEQAQQMQENLKQIQDELGNVEVTGVAGAGLVKIVMTCKYTLKRVSISKAAIEGALEDPDMLEGMVRAAFDDAAKKVEQAVQKKMSALTAGVQLPTDMFKLSL